MKEKNRSLWEQILSFKRSSHLKREEIEDNHSLMCVTFSALLFLLLTGASSGSGSAPFDPNALGSSSSSGGSPSSAASAFGSSSSGSQPQTGSGSSSSGPQSQTGSGASQTGGTGTYDPLKANAMATSGFNPLNPMLGKLSTKHEPLYCTHTANYQ